MKKLTLLIVLVVVVGIISAFAARAHYNRSTAASTTATKQDQNDGYYLTGRIVKTKNGKEELMATWIKQGDRRGWRVDQFYVNYVTKEGKVDFQSRQWCIVGKGAFVQHGGVDKPVKQIGPCNLFPQDYAGDATRQLQATSHLGETSVIDSHQRDNGISVESTIAPRLGTLVKMVQRHPNGIVITDEALTISYQPVSEEIFVLP